MPPARKKNSTATRPPRSSPLRSKSPKLGGTSVATTPSFDDSENSLSELDRLIADNPVLSKEEQAVASPEKLFHTNLKFAILLANESRLREKLGKDAVPVALRGLWAACQTFDPAQSRFTSWARWAICRALFDEIASRNPGIRLSLHALRMLRRLRAGETLSQAQASNVSGLDPVFLDSDARDEGGALRSQIASDDLNPREQRLKSETPELAERWMQEALTPTENFVLRSRFGFGESGPALLQDVAEKLGVSRQRVEQIEKKALRKLREHVRLQKAW
jgi:RNA polymerase primary sigma factor